MATLEAALVDPLPLNKCRLITTSGFPCGRSTGSTRSMRRVVSRAGDRAPPQNQGVLRVDQVRSQEWWTQVKPRPAKDGTCPAITTWLPPGERLNSATHSCASCHPRVMPDGTVVKGAQGNFPFDLTSR